MSLSPEVLIAVTAGAATFVGSVTADEQQARLRNGTFGAAAGASLGGIVAIIDKKPEMLIWSAFGASVGAVAGWIVYLGLCVIATFPFGRRILEYSSGGLSSLRSRLDRDDNDLLLRGLTAWNVSFSRQIDQQASAILQTAPTPAADVILEMVIRSWLASVVDTFNVIFSRVAGRTEYRLRASLIVFGRIDGKVGGKHWIFYSGESASHRPKLFTEQSIAYQVISGELPSPSLHTLSDANRQGQNRGTETYTSFYAFRITRDAMLSVDWPEEVKTDDQFVTVARDFIHTELAPALRKLLDRWSQPLASEVQLDPLFASSTVVSGNGVTTSSAETEHRVTQPLTPDTKPAGTS